MQIHFLAIGSRSIGRTALQSLQQFRERCFEGRGDLAQGAQPRLACTALKVRDVDLVDAGLLGKVDLPPTPGAAQLSDPLTRRCTDFLCHSPMFGLVDALYLAHTLFWLFNLSNAQPLHGRGKKMSNATDDLLRSIVDRTARQQEREVEMEAQIRKDDRADHASKKEWSVWFVAIGVLFSSILSSLDVLFRGKSLNHFGQDLVFSAVGFFVIWILNRVYHEFRFRTKEMTVKVSALEEKVDTSIRLSAKVLGRLTEIDEKLDTRRREKS